VHVKKIIFVIAPLSLSFFHPVLAKTYHRVALILSSTEYDETKVENLAQWICLPTTVQRVWQNKITFTKLIVCLRIIR